MPLLSIYSVTGSTEIDTKDCADDSPSESVTTSPNTSVSPSGVAGAVKLAVAVLAPLSVTLVPLICVQL